MSEPDTPLDAALDVFVYAPVGLALNAAEEIPKLAAKGRAQLSMARVVGRFAVAQARQQVIERLTSSVTGGTTPAAGGTTPAAGGTTPDRPPPGETTPAAGGTTADRPPPGDNGETGPLPPPSGPIPPGEDDRPGSSASAVPPAEPGPDWEAAKPVPDWQAAEPVPDWQAAESVPAAEPGPDWQVGALGDAERQPDDPSGLAIPGYDSLAASQVVPRLAGLSVDELTAVETYETAHRARRTILTRVRQLQER
jgi:hypothetical protein